LHFHKTEEIRTHEVSVLSDPCCFVTREDLINKLIIYTMLKIMPKLDLPALLHFTLQLCCCCYCCC